jgi:glutaredoxin
MPKYNRQNIDRKTNKPNPIRTEGITDDQILNRAYQTRRDDDVIRNPQRTVYDVDFAIKSYIEQEIQPQITDNNELINVPVIFSNGEKWDNVRRLGFLRDEKGKLQSPLIMIKRNTVNERDNVKGLDVNRNADSNVRAYQQRYNQRNRYEDELFPIPTNQPQESKRIYVVDIPRYVTIEYELLLWCDFTTQLNDVIDQILPYNRFAWGNDGNRFTTIMGSISFETVNTVGEDRLVRATIPLTVTAALLPQQEARVNTLRTMFSVKKVVFDTVVDIDSDLFGSTQISSKILQAQSFVSQGGMLLVSSGAGATTQIDAATMLYITSLTEKTASFSSATTVTINEFAAINPVTLAVATKNEFDLYINGQYIDKTVYTWTPSDITSQTIIFDTGILGFDILSDDVIVVKGRWA